MILERKVNLRGLFYAVKYTIDEAEPEVGLMEDEYTLISAENDTGSDLLPHFTDTAINLVIEQLKIDEDGL